MELQTDSGRFEFVHVPGAFKTLGSKETNEQFFKWGMIDNMEAQKFRFN
jgi:hypothetical protein